MFSEKSVGKHAFFLLIDRIEGKEGRYTLYNIYKREEGQLGLAGFIGAAGFVGMVGVVGVVGVAECGGCCRNYSQKEKKSFFLFLPSHPHKCGSSALLIGVSRVRVSVRVELLPSHLPSHYPHTSGTGKYTVRVNLQNLTKVPEKYSYLVPTVQHRYTNSIAMPDYQYSYAGLSVQLCRTISIAMLHFWCKGAALLLALLFESLYSGFSGGRRTSFLHSIILNRPTADNSSLAFPPAAERCFFILHSSFSLLHGAL